MGRDFLGVILSCDPHIATESQRSIGVQGVLFDWIYMARFDNSAPQHKKESC